MTEKNTDKNLKKDNVSIQAFKRNVALAFYLSAICIIGLVKPAYADWFNVGKEEKKTMDVTSVVKRYYFCGSNLLEKTIEAQARKQLNKNFGSDGRPDCRGLTLEELSRVDFSKLDFSEVVAEMQKKIVSSNIKNGRTNE